MPRNRGGRNNRPLEPTTRTEVMSWLGIFLPVSSAIFLMLSTLWEPYMSPWIRQIFDEKPKLLALTAATFAILAILTPSQTLSKQHLTVVIFGGLTGYAAVVNTFDVRNVPVALAIIMSTIPIFIYLTSTWRLPKGWEWATWSAAISLVVIIATMVTANTNAGLLFAIFLGEENAFTTMGIIVVIGVFILFVALSFLAVKAVGSMQAGDTSAYIRNQARGGRK